MYRRWPLLLSLETVTCRMASGQAGAGLYRRRTQVFTAFIESSSEDPWTTRGWGSRRPPSPPTMPAGSSYTN